MDIHDDVPKVPADAADMTQPSRKPARRTPAAPASISVLLLSDRPVAARRLGTLAARKLVPPVALEAVERVEEALKRLATRKPDVLLLDLRLSGSSLEALRQARTSAPDVPIVVLAGAKDEAIAQQALRDGAIDFIREAGLDAGMLSRTMRYALEERDSLRGLRGIEDHYRHLFEQNPQPMWVADHVSRRFLAVNEAAIREYGWSREEFLRMSLADIRPKEQIPLLQAYLERLQHGKMPEGTGSGDVWTHRRRDGSRLKAELTWNVIRFQDHDAWLVLARNVTERLGAEAALRETDERWRALVEHTTDFITIIDRDWNVEFINRPTQEYKVEQVVGRPIFDFVLPGQVEKIRKLFQRVIDKGQAIQYETSGYAAGGAVARYESRLIPILREGRLSRLMMLSTDISERKRQAELLHLREKQQEAVAQLGQIALEGMPMQTLLDDAVALVARVMDAPFCRIRQVLPGGGGLQVRSGHGWRADCEERGVSPQESATLANLEPVTVEDFDLETRFEAGDYLEAHDVVSGVTVPIFGTAGPWGVLGAHFGRERDFLPEDVNFLSAVANVLAAAIERVSADEENSRLQRLLGEARQVEAIAEVAGGLTRDLCRVLSEFAEAPEGELQAGPTIDSAELRQGLEQFIAKADSMSGGLATGRKSVPAPQESVDLSVVASRLRTALRRLLGPNVELEMELEPRLGRARVHAFEIERMLRVFALGARERLGDRGTLRIRTSNLATAKGRRAVLEAEAGGAARGAAGPAPTSSLAISIAWDIVGRIGGDVSATSGDDGTLAIRVELPVG